LGSGSGYLLSGVIAVAFGTLAVLIRKHSVRTSRGVRASVERFGFRPPSERFQEALQGAGGAVFVLVGAGLIITGVILLS
jgi:hypothetical protein